MALQRTYLNPNSQTDPIARIAFERPALALCYPSLNSASASPRLNIRFGKDSERKGPNHPTVTLVLSSFVELERRDMIAIGSSTFMAGRGEAGGMWVTKKVPSCPGKGMVADLFNCITHGYSALEEVVARYFRDYYRQDPWTLASVLGAEEARAYGYVISQQWPASRVKRMMSRFGLSSDVETYWVKDGVKVREATQAARLLRVHIDEFRANSRGIYEGMRLGIEDAINKLDEHLTPGIIRLPLLKKRLATG